jgi:cell fate regulator YaaT (PSP1 superfamily)
LVPGRELCCSTWLTDFKRKYISSTLPAAVLESTKLAGQCGKLKCCLNYELDTYMDALKASDFETKLVTEKKEICQNKIFSKD